MLAAILGVLGVVLGAIGSTIITLRIQHGRLFVAIDDVSISAGDPPSIAVASANRELVRELSLATYNLTDKDVPRGDVPQGVYLDYLNDVKTTARLNSTFLVPSLVEAGEALAQSLGAGDFESFEKTWAEEQTFIWRHLQAEVSQGNFKLDVSSHLQPGATEYRQIVVDDDGDILVLLTPGVQFLFFPSSQIVEILRPPVREFAENCAKAFCFRIRPALEALVSKIRSVAGDAAALDQIVNHVDLEVDKYRRLSVSGIFSNSGSYPLSVLNQADAVLALAGYPTSDASPPTTIKHNLSVPMFVGRPEGDFGSPITVSGGIGARFRSISASLKRSTIRTCHISVVCDEKKMRPRFNETPHQDKGRETRIGIRKCEDRSVVERLRSG